MVDELKFFHRVVKKKTTLVVTMITLLKMMNLMKMTLINSECKIFMKSYL